MKLQLSMADGGPAGAALTTLPAPAPVDLDTVPAVDAFLARLGLGAYDRETLASPPGRNDVWSGFTATGCGVFVKRLHGPDAGDRLRRILSFEGFRVDAALPGVSAPALLGVDPEHHLAAFELVEDATSGLQMLVEETFTDADTHRIGAALAVLHGSSPPAGLGIDDLPPPLPPLSVLAGLPLPMIEAASAAELDVWRLLQNDTVLVATLSTLRQRERAAPQVPVHCDLRMDQLLFVGDRVWLTDWEEFRLGDAARDVGSLAGEWLHRAVLDIVTSRGDTEASLIDGALDHDTVVRRGVAKIQRLRPRIQHFWASYTAGRCDLDPAMSDRVTAFAGWHMLDRLLASSASQGRLSGIERAAAGIGRAMLLTPERFAGTIGLLA